ncbi:hypothetical protein HaLaN_10213, partial [Haematococcus lacustris]
MYMTRMMTRAVRDPCIDDNPDYEEGLRRMEQFLDPPAIREVLMCHHTIRMQQIPDFGRINLEGVRNKQAWLVTNCRNAVRSEPGGPTKW